MIVAVGPLSTHTHTHPILVTQASQALKLLKRAADKSLVANGPPKRPKRSGTEISKRSL